MDSTSSLVSPGGLFVGGGPGLTGIVGESAAMERVRRLVDKVAASTAPVLIAGETGTGKEVVARSLHFRGARRAHRFLALNCGALPEALLESELFGHARGAFTGAIRDHRGAFEEANHGTLFLDEIGDMPPAMQVKLLRVLEEREIRRVGSSEPIPVDVRIVSATHKDLRKEIEAERFRRDLYYRLDVLRIRLPPLRDRPGDVVLLARYFVEQYSARAGKRLGGFTPDALRALAGYGFPGNVRELQNEIEHAVALAATGDDLDVHLLSPEIVRCASRADAGDAGGSLRQNLRNVERRFIVEELRRQEGNRTRSAARLGISVRALQKKIIRLGIQGS